LYSSFQPAQATEPGEKALIIIVHIDPESGEFTTSSSATIPAQTQRAQQSAFDPAVNRIFARFKDAGAVTRGSASVAVRTQ
jgi:hypothetical protein